MKFYSILRKTQKELKAAVKKSWLDIGYNVIEEDGFLYKEGTFPVLLVAHMDTMHAEKPHVILRKKGILSSPNGIGGDDRCGIYMIQEIIRKYDCSVLLTEDEEIGCVGATKFAMSDLAQKLKGKFCYIIEFDRRGSNDAVFYDLDNPDFEWFICQQHWNLAFGSYSDICEIAPVLECAAVNLSCGYYDEHKKHETINLSEMNKNINEACKLLARTDTEVQFEWIESPMAFKSKGNWWGADDYWYGSTNQTGGLYVIATEEIEEVYDACSMAEAIGFFLMDYPTACFDDIVSMYQEL